MGRGWQEIIGKGFNRAEFKEYLRTVRFGAWRPEFVVIHNTAAPTLTQWHSVSGQTRMRNLRHFYKNERGWTAGPHLFVADDLIWVFTPLNVYGVHSPSWNKISLGVEIVGDYNRESFTGEVKKNAISAVASLHEVFGIDIAKLKFHKEDTGTTHDCPGKNIVKNDFLGAVKAEMQGDGNEHSPGELSEVISNELPPATDSSAKTLKSHPELAEIFAGRLLLGKGRTNPKEAVGLIQDALNSLNVSFFKIDLGSNNRYRGIFGPKTKQAIINFQKAHDLDADGLVGKSTIKMLDKVLSTSPGSRANLVSLETVPEKPVEKATLISETFETTSPSSVAHRGNTSKTSGAKITTRIYSDGVIIKEFIETIEAFRDGRKLGPQTATQYWVKKGNETRIRFNNYSYLGRDEMMAYLYDEFGGFAKDAKFEEVLASHFGKKDDIDEGTGSPWVGVVQTNSDVMGVALPKRILQDNFGEDKTWENPKLKQAMVEVYNPDSRRMARVPIVDVGPAANATARVDLTMALDNYLRGTGMTLVQYRLIIP